MFHVISVQTAQDAVHQVAESSKETTNMGERDRGRMRERVIEKERGGERERHVCLGACIALYMYFHYVQMGIS